MATSAPRKSVRSQQQQEQPNREPQAQPREEKFNVAVLAEKLLALERAVLKRGMLLGDYGYSSVLDRHEWGALVDKARESPGLPLLEWLRSLRSGCFDVILEVLFPVHWNAIIRENTVSWIAPNHEVARVASPRTGRPPLFGHLPDHLLGVHPATKGEWLALLEEIRQIDILPITAGRPSWPDIENVIRGWYPPPPPAIGSQGPTTHGATVAQQDDRILTKQGTRYFPVSLAAEIAQVPRTTLVDWIKAKKTFAGRSLQIYNSPTARKLFLSEESVERLVNRFVKWSAEEKKPAGPAGPVKIAKTIAIKQDQSGYIGLAKAAKAIGADYHTLWLWATQGKEAPGNKPLDVIQDTASEQFYIRHKDVTELKPLIPKSGLRRGRRAQVKL
jgi:hypothetical protein